MGLPQHPVNLFGSQARGCRWSSGSSCYASSEAFSVGGQAAEKIYLFIACDPPCVRGFSLTTQGVLCLVLSFLPVGLVTPPSLSVLEDVSEVQNIQGEEKD